MSRLRAVVLDFDGTLVDSEMPIYEDVARVLAAQGLALSVEGWAGCVGLGHDDSHRALCAAVGQDLDREALEAAVAQQDRTWEEHLPLLPGAAALIEALDGAGIALAVASSSSTRWVDGHLRRLGVRDRFAVVATRDVVDGRTKPDPASYRYAISALGIDPTEVVAIEDSAPGIAAAHGAGLRVVAIPSAITRFHDLSDADGHAASLADLDVDRLAAVLARRP